MRGTAGANGTTENAGVSRKVRIMTTIITVATLATTATTTAVSGRGYLRRR